MFEIDSLIFQQINSLAGQWVCLDALAIFFADYLQYVLVILTVVFLWKNWKAVFFAFLAAGIGKFAFAELIRFFWSRPRPFVENDVNLLVSHVNEPAFPSGHATFFFALSFVVYQYNKKAGILFFTASSLIAVSRVFSGVHWPMDVLAGAAVGLFSGWLVMKIARKF